MPKGVLKRLDFINEKCLTRFGTKFSRNTLSKPIYRELWHPKYAQGVVTQKEPGFSFKLAMGCVRANRPQSSYHNRATYKLHEA